MAVEAISHSNKLTFPTAYVLLLLLDFGINYSPINFYSVFLLIVKSEFTT